MDYFKPITIHPTIPSPQTTPENPSRRANNSSTSSSSSAETEIASIFSSPDRGPTLGAAFPSTPPRQPFLAATSPSRARDRLDVGEAKLHLPLRGLLMASLLSEEDFAVGEKVGVVGIIADAWLEATRGYVSFDTFDQRPTEGLRIFGAPSAKTWSQALSDKYQIEVILHHPSESPLPDPCQQARKESDSEGDENNDSNSGKREDVGAGETDGFGGKSGTKPLKRNSQASGSGRVGKDASGTDRENGGQADVPGAAGPGDEGLGAMDSSSDDQQQESDLQKLGGESLIHSVSAILREAGTHNTKAIGENQIVLRVPKDPSQQTIQTTFSVEGTESAKLHTALLAVRVPPGVIEVITTSAEEEVEPVLQEQHTQPDQNQTSLLFSLWKPGGSIGSTRTPSVSTTTAIQGPPMPFKTRPVSAGTIIDGTTNEVYHMTSRRIIPTSTTKNSRIRASCPIVLTTRHDPLRVGLDIVLQSHHIVALDNPRPMIKFGCGAAIFSSLKITDLYKQVGSSNEVVLWLCNMDFTAVTEGTSEIGIGVGAAVLRRGPDLRLSRVRKFGIRALSFFGGFASATASRKAQKMREKDKQLERSQEKDVIPTANGPLEPHFFTSTPGTSQLASSTGIVSDRPEDFELDDFEYNGKSYKIGKSVIREEEGGAHSEAPAEDDSLVPPVPTSSPSDDEIVDFMASFSPF
ncbi:hypothetical protein T439DRAFT_360915 [Meredithblackwellia eburnea MCA 4105]